MSIRANREVVEELRGDERMCQALLEIMEPEINRIVKEATEKETRRLKEENRKEAERLKEENRKEAERLKEENRKEAERLKEENRKETDRLKEESRKKAVETASKMLKSGKFSVKEVKDFVPRLLSEEIEAIAADIVSA